MAKILNRWHGDEPRNTRFARFRRIARNLRWGSKELELEDPEELFCTPLHSAAYHGGFEAAVMLIREGADVNAVDRNSETPLSLAVKAGFINVVRLLLKAGADPTIRDANGLDARTLAHATAFSSQPEKRQTLLKISQLLASPPVAKA